MTKIKPCLWFDREAEEAATFYTGLFPGGAITALSRYGEGMPVPAGTVMLVEFSILGQDFQALNGGPHFTFTEAISMSVSCADQAEVDRYWDALIADGGRAVQCGWLKDRFGLSWQIVPEMMTRLQVQGGPGVDRMMHAMMKMVKLDIQALERAYAGDDA
ncbi:MAG: VOC family protein [Sphingobium sp.]|uniref:VOC family protein n=1 Tax=Sphingobium sp. TaxID=1912891 RepID=UPI0029A35DEE|nr:VOC family protein [Sphingobium sp.]MDX3911663.1 VOC family protein [Sphingobium sp.]